MYIVHIYPKYGEKTFCLIAHCGLPKQKEKEQQLAEEHFQGILRIKNIKTKTGNDFEDYLKM